MESLSKKMAHTEAQKDLRKEGDFFSPLWYSTARLITIREKNKEKETFMGKGIAGGVGGLIVRIVVGIAVVGLLTGGGILLKSNSRLFRNTDYLDLDAALEQNQELPQGKFGQVTAAYILDVFALGSESVSTWGIKMKSGEEQYYMAVIRDGSVISVKVNDKTEIAEMEALANQFWDYVEEDKEFLEIPDYILKGKVSRLEEQKLKRYYDERWDELGLEGAFVKSDIMIDATAIPGTNILLYIVLPVVVLGTAVCIFCIIRAKKKKQQQEAEKDYDMNAYYQGGYSGTDEWISSQPEEERRSETD